MERYRQPVLIKLEQQFKLADDPRPQGCIKLTGSKNIYRIREGVYRIVYEVTDNILTVYVFDVDHRKQVYR